MSLHEGVADEYPVFVCNENFLFGEDDTTYAISGARNALTIKFAYVFMPVGAVNAAFVAVDAQIERSTVLYHRLVKR